MGKIDRTMQPKHRETLSRYHADFVREAAQVPLPLLQKHLDTFPTIWPFPKGDLYHWIPLLDRFDNILERFVAAYKLKDGPQTCDFGLELLTNSVEGLDYRDRRGKTWNEEDLQTLGYSQFGDATVVEGVLQFTCMLLRNCGNRSIYASSHRLDNLLNTTSLSLLNATLSVGLELAMRYQASVKRLGSTPNRQLSAAILANHYNIDLDRVNAISSLFERPPARAVPGSGPDAHWQETSYAHDFVAIAMGADSRWSDWGDVSVSQPRPVSETRPAASSSGHRASPNSPASPTPLRRSSTSAQQQGQSQRAGRSNGADDSGQSPKRGTVAGAESNSAARITFHVSRSMVAAQPIYDLVKAIPQDAPPRMRYEIFHRLRVAKALLGSRAERQQLLATRLLAMTNLVYIVNDEGFATRHPERAESKNLYLVYQLAELIHPHGDGAEEVPIWLQTLAIRLLDPLSSMHTWTSDVVTALNANVTHGVLLYVIRKALASIKQETGQERTHVTAVDEWRRSLIALTSTIALGCRFGNDMVSAGLMDVMLEVIAVRSEITGRRFSTPLATWQCQVLQFLDGIIWLFPNAFQGFFSGNGLDAISDLVVGAIEDCQNGVSPESGNLDSALQSNSIDYQIHFPYQHMLKWLLKIIHHVMSQTFSFGNNTDRLLRNLADKTDLLKGLASIIDSKHKFGSVVWTSTATILSDFINNDPTSFGAISESGMIKIFLETIIDGPLPDDQKSADEQRTPHTAIAEGSLALGILPSSDAMGVVPLVINSLSLNNAGMDMVISSRALAKYLEIFESPRHVQCMHLDPHVSSNIGAQLDELARHHPSLRDTITEAVVGMVGNVAKLAEIKEKRDDWGVKLHPLKESGETVPVEPQGAGQEPHGSSATKMAPATGDEDVEMAEASAETNDQSPGKENLRVPDNWSPYINAISSFLEAYFENAVLKEAFGRKGGVAILLDLASSEILPHNFLDGSGARYLSRTISKSLENSSAIWLPVLLTHTLSALRIVEPLLANSDEAYFLKYVSEDPAVIGPSSLDAPGIAVPVLRALLRVQIFVKALSECFSQPSRSSNPQFYAGNAYDYYFLVVQKLCDVVPSIAREFFALSHAVPAHWSPNKRPGHSENPREDGATNGHGQDHQEASASGEPGDGARLSSQDGSAPTAPKKPSKEELKSTRYKNFTTLRHILEPMMQAPETFLQTIGKALLPKRPGSIFRYRHIQIAGALGSGLVGPLKQTVEAAGKPSRGDLWFWSVMLRTIRSSLIDRSGRHNDRPAPVIVPFLCGLKEAGLFEVLNQLMTQLCKQVVTPCGENAHEKTRTARQSAEVVGKILDLYRTLTNGRIVTDPYAVFIERRDPTLPSHLGVDVRRRILPSLVQAWHGSMAEADEEGLLRTLVEILISICSPDEPSTLAESSLPIHNLFKETNQKFPWQTYATHVAQVVEAGFAEELAAEATYRTSGNAQNAIEYCKAVTGGLGAYRHAIPPDDAYVPAPESKDSKGSDDSADESEEEAEDAEAMVVDPPESEVADEPLSVAGNSAMAGGLNQGIPSGGSGGGANNEAASGSQEGPDSQPTKAKYTFSDAKRDLDKSRQEFRDGLIDRCLEVISMHPTVAHEIADLINNVILRQPHSGDAREEVANTLVNALSSLAPDEDENNENGDTIAAYAHLLALLLQDARFFASCSESLRDRVDEYIGFLKVAPARSQEPLPQWMPHILLILELVLAQSELPLESKWTPPASLDDKVEQPVVEVGVKLVEDSQRSSLLDHILDILPRIGKDAMLATSVLRILVILCRTPALVARLGEKRNLQRLFLMAKQMSFAGADSLRETKITSSIMMILRHIIEDEETVKQVMKTEIQAFFETFNSRNSRSPEMFQYLRALSDVSLRNPPLFVQATNEMVRLVSGEVPLNDNGRHSKLVLKEKDKPPSEGEARADVDQAVDDLSVAEMKKSIQDIKQSTEDTDMTDAPRAAQEIKRPVVENPDGVVHFLLCELLNYRDVYDKPPNPAPAPRNQKSAPEQSPDAGGTDSTADDPTASESKDKKQPKAVFRSDEHPIFIYKCFLLNCLAELLGSYNRTKVEFINFKRSQPPIQLLTPVKPRSSILNYLINEFLCRGDLNASSDSVCTKKDAAVAAHAQRVLVALVSKTGERIPDRTKPKFEYDEDEPDLIFVRKFVLDTVLKAYEKTVASDDEVDARYWRMMCLAELIYNMLGEKDGAKDTLQPRSSDAAARSYAQIRRMMYEKGYLEKFANSIAEIELEHPRVMRVLKHILRVARTLTNTAKDLSLFNVIPQADLPDPVEDDEASNSSISDMEDREDTPDLYRNSALGMLEPMRDEDESEDEDDEDMYDEEYGDEMEYEDDEENSDHEDTVSDEEAMAEIGEIEGLHGDAVLAADDDDDDEDSEDSDDMEDIEEPRVEIVDEAGNPVDDDGASDWESDTDDEDQDDEDDPDEDVDYEAEAQDMDEGHIHILPAHGPGDNAMLTSISIAARDALNEQEAFDSEFMPISAEQYSDEDREGDEEEEDEDEENEEEDYIFEHGFLDDHPDGHGHSVGWDMMIQEPSSFLAPESAVRHASVSRHSRPMTPSLIVGSHRDLVDFPSLASSRPQRNGGHPGIGDEEANPLLRRSNAPNGELQAHWNPLAASISRAMPPEIRGPNMPPLSWVNELMELLPSLGPRGGHPGGHMHFQVTSGLRSDFRESGMPREHRHADRRDHSIEPQQAVSFSPETTTHRYQEAARMIFGSFGGERSQRLMNHVMSQLLPAAMAKERENKAKREEALRKAEEESKRQLEEKKKREEEERLAREAREAEEARERERQREQERLERERREAEEREAAARIAAEAQNANEQAMVTDEAGTPSANETGSMGAGSVPMEGVESAPQSTETVAQAEPSNRPRVMTRIRGENVDITELGIDPDYIAALPEEFREEVIAQAVSARRSAAREEATTTGERSAIYQEFLDVLPDDLRHEIMQQERHEQRRRAREEQRRQSGPAGRDREGEEMDPASILLTFPESLRNQVLMDQGETIVDSLPPEMARQARTLIEHQAAGSSSRHTYRRHAVSSQARAGPVERAQRRTVIQMLDKSGIATLFRLMFMAQTQLVRAALFSIFSDVCENRQNRLDVVSTLLQVLQDGTADAEGMERSFGQLSLRAKRSRDGKEAEKTPLKRTLTDLSTSTSLSKTKLDLSPLQFMTQCLALLEELCMKSHAVSGLFLTEHDFASFSLKRSASKKGKARDTKAQRYAINVLLSLLEPERDHVMNLRGNMATVASLLNRITMPLLAVERRRREAEEKEAKDAKEAAEKAEAEAAQAPPAAESSASTAQPPDEGTANSQGDATAGGPQAASSAQAGNGSSSGTADAAKAEGKDAPKKKPKPFTLPYIPTQNLTMLIRIFVARECSSKTFQNTISAIKNLSTIPGAKVAFGDELVRQARALSESIVTDLDELLPHITKVKSGTELQGIALAKFSPGASDQNKLLRILTALDHLFEGKRKRSGKDGEENSDDFEKQSFVSSLYRNSTFSTMWEKLGACLSEIRQRENMLNVATILLPLIESLMVVCKNTATAEEEHSQSQPSRDMVLSSPPPESPISNLFFSFTEEHRRILNELVRNNPKLMSGTFALLVKNPKVLEFDNKRNYFQRSVNSRNGNPARPSFPHLQLSVRRDQVFHDSFKHLFYKTGDEMKYGKLNVRFNGEDGVDAGGVTREWFQVLTRQMFDPNYVLFTPVSSDRTTFHPNKLSGINDEHLQFFKFIGRIIGKALYENRLLDCYFSRAVYKRILGKSVSVKDMESFDPDYYKSLVWMLDNDITDVVMDTFAVEDDQFGVKTVHDLVRDGHEVSVTEENKHDYVRLVVEHKLLTSVKDQMEAFLKGFHDIIPADLISIFNEQELELLISGLPDIDCNDWRQNTEYSNYTPSSQQIQWFWRAVRSFDKEERAKLLQFVTGTSKVPLNGFKELEGMNGVNRFSIHRDYGNKERLPSSHTCFNQLDLPEYDSYDLLRRQLLKAITAGSDYFGLA